MTTAQSLVSQPKKPPVDDVGELDWTDLDALTEDRDDNHPRVHNVRAIHHKTAQMLAAGCSNHAVSAATGLSYNYVSLLKNDPAFSELLEHYRHQEEEIWWSVREKAAMIGLTATEEIQNRLTHNPDDFSLQQLLKVMQSGLDYGGHAPPQRSENVNVFATAEEIATIKQGQAENVSVREGPSGDDGGTESVIEGEYEAAEGREAVREEGAGSAGEDVEHPSDTVD